MGYQSTDPRSKPTSLHEKCGVFGVYGAGTEAARLTYFGLQALQHRGQEGTGIVSSDGQQFYSHKGAGLVSHVYTEDAIAKLSGTLAIGHNRYSTSQGTDTRHVQPVLEEDDMVAVAHNGNLPSTEKLEQFLIKNQIDISDHNDSELMAAAIRFYLRSGFSLEKALEKSYPLFTGAFALLVMTKDKIAALRDHCGIRPLCIGELDDSYIFASESCALDTVQATLLREVEAGEMVVVDQEGLRSKQLTKPNQKLDIFEFIYFARPDSIILGKSVDQVRHNLGVELAKEHPISADIVIPIPDSAIPAAMGYAHQTGIPFYHGLIKNRYIGRTFIQPEQHLRERSVQMKLNPLRHVLEGKSVVVIDDSLVRGTTSKKIIEMLRKAGASEVHFLVASPPYRYPDFYGIDTPAQSKLLAFNRTEEEIETYLGADSLSYLSFDGMIQATGHPASHFSTPCFTGVYPLDIGARRAEIIFEDSQAITPEVIELEVTDQMVFA